MRFSINKIACGRPANRSRTPLFEAILRCAWTDVLIFLQTGIWERHTDFSDSTLTPAEQAQKWLSYHDQYSEDRLRQLPLHAAITHLAPLPIVELLVQLYPHALSLPDNNSNLPLHLAFLTCAHDVSAYLLKMNPQALMIANEHGKLPVECYHHTFRTVPTKKADGCEDMKERKELLRLEQSIAKDCLRMTSAESQLQDLMQDIQNISNYGQHRIMSMNGGE